MNKKYSLTTKCMLSLMIMICLVATINAFEFDNTLSYDTNTKTATITNAFGLGEKIADVKLTSALKEYVLRGKDVKVAEFELSNYKKDYDNALAKIDTYDLRKANVKIDRTFNYKYYSKIGTINKPIYIQDCKESFDAKNQSSYEDCTRKQTGTSIEDVYSWIAFKELSELPEGNVRVGIFTEVKEGDYVEWIPTFFGVQINEWASWTDSFNDGLVGYWNLDATTGTNYQENFKGILNGTVIPLGAIDYVVGATGKNNYGFREKGGSFINVTYNNLLNSITTNMSISVWLNITDVNAGDYALHRGGNTWGIRCGNYVPDTCEFDLFDGGGLKHIEPTTTILHGGWQHYVMVANGSHIAVWINGALKGALAYDGTIAVSTTKTLQFLADSNVGVMDNATIDEIAIYNRTLSPTEISNLYNSGNGIFPSYSSPVVTLNIPIDGFITTNTSVTFNCSVTSSKPMLNVSLYINDILNWTVENTTAGELGLGLQKLIVFSEGYRNWSCKGYNNLNEFKLSDTRWFNVSTNYNYVVNSFSYGNSSNETETKSFIMNITYNPDKYTSGTSTFYFNQTAYTPTITTSGTSDLLISKDIDIPLVSVGINKTLYWEFALTNATGTHYFNSSPYNQTVVPIHFGICNDTGLSALYLNFTFKDEATNDNMNATIDSSTWWYYLGTGTINRTFLFSNSTANPSYAFCSNTTGLPIKAAVSDMHYLYTLYPTRTLTELFSLTSTVTNKVLYLLSTSTGIYSTYQVVTPGNQVIQGAHLIVTRIISGSTVVVADGYTDSAGTVTFFLNPNYDHTITVSASGYASQTITLKPSSSTYTITMGGSGEYFQFSSLLEGVTYNFYPASGIISSGVHNFTFEVFSSLYALQNCSMQIRNISTTLYTVTGCINSSRGYLSQVINVTKHPQLYGNYSIRINDTWLQIEGDARWKNFANESSSGIGASLKDALKDLYSLPEWGTDAQKSDFSRIVFFFLFFAIILAGINFYSSYDTAYPGSLFWIMTPVVLLLTIINGPGGPGFFYLAGATNLGFGGSFTSVVDNWILPVHFVLLLIIYFFTTNRRYQG